jgi:hypothetical protein
MVVGGAEDAALGRLGRDQQERSRLAEAPQKPPRLALKLDTRKNLATFRGL